jgi:uncharacterized membrane protein
VRLVRDANDFLVARLLAEVILCGVIGLIALAPGADWQSYLLGIAFVALAAFIVVHSHRQRKRRPV